MGQVDTFEITFDNNQEVYREGDQVEGFIRIVNSDQVKYKGKLGSQHIHLSYKVKYLTTV